jgi:HlyD family secretion protein
VTAGSARRAVHRHLAVAAGTAGLLVVAVAGWAATMQLAGAVIASGVLVVESNVKKVQHPTGGVVGELLVADGDHVEAGQIVMRLDEVQTRAALGVIERNLDELVARQARLLAERDGEAEIAFPEALLARAGTAEIGRLVAGERRHFELRRAARDGQKAQLAERISQLGQELDGLAGQITAKARELELIESELSSVRGLLKKNLVPIDRVNALERQAARLEGERGALLASSAQTRGRITETELQIIQIDQNLRSEVARELGDIRKQASELTERRIGAEDMLKRVDIRSPQAGIVNELAVHTVGGVVSPGEAIMLIVPGTDELTVEARVTPYDVDQIEAGQTAVLRFSAFSHNTTPELSGEVSRISPDVRRDERTGERYYVVRIRVPPAELQKLGGLKLVPGMPVEAFLKTSPRTVASYFVKPLRDQVQKAFRD